MRLTKELQGRYVNIQGPITLVPSELPPQVLAGAPLLVSPGTQAPKGAFNISGPISNAHWLNPACNFQPALYDKS